MTPAARMRRPAHRVCSPPPLEARALAPRAGRRGGQRFLPQPPLHRLRRPPGGLRAHLAGAAHAPAAGLVAGARRRAGDAAPAGRRLAAAGGLDAGRRGAVLFRRPVRPGAAAGRPRRRAARRWSGHTLDHPDMPEAVRLDVPDWVLPHLQRALRRRRWRPSWRRCRREAPLDLRVNLLKATREAGAGGAGGGGDRGGADAASPWGLRVAGRRPVTAGAAFRGRAGGDPGRGQPAAWPRWWARRRRCGWRTGAPAPAARRWRWP